MPRKPRFLLDGVPAHIVQRGHNRDPVFFEDDDYTTYLGFLAEALVASDCQLHAYALMNNHVHLLVTPERAEGISRLMQAVGRRYVPYINAKYDNSGALWEGRFKSSLIDADSYLFACMRYIELNPVKAQMCQSPGQYRWSSYAANGQGKTDLLVTPHTLYQALAENAHDRQARYRDLFCISASDEEISALRDAVQTGTPLGNDRFREQIEQKLKRKVGQARRGRPTGWRKPGAAEDARQASLLE